MRLRANIGSHGMETVFFDQGAERAATRFHLTARQAGLLARAIGVKHLVPLHCSPLYSDNPEALRREADAAFAGTNIQLMGKLAVHRFP